MYFIHSAHTFRQSIAGPLAPESEANLLPRWPLDEATWLWHPEIALGEPGFVLFRLEFEWSGGPLRWSVSGDQAYEIAIDGLRVGRGPDSGAPQYWAFEAYEANLAKGRHTIEALVWWLGSANFGSHATPQKNPAGRMTWRSGFALAGNNVPKELLHTGLAAWRCAKLDGWKLEGKINDVYHAVGLALQLEVEQFLADSKIWSVPVTVRAPVAPNPHGVLTPGWKLAPSELPAPRVGARTCGIARAVLGSADSPLVSPVYVDAEVDPGQATAQAWQRLVSHDEPLKIAAGESVSVVCDFQDYVCGYPEIRAQGQQLEIGFFWAESLFLDEKVFRKGHRDAVAGRWFFGFGDTFTFSTETVKQISSHWWRAGRYALVTVRNSSEHAGWLDRLRILETGYATGQNVGHFSSSDETTGSVLDLCVRGLRACRHDVFCDTPYYEQMMYTADTRLQILMNYVLWPDDRLAKRAIALHNASRDGEGWSAMRFPSDLRQTSSTFAMIWVWMLHDFARWRDQPAWWRKFMPGVRALLGACERYTVASALLAKPPGWSFIDWVPEWHEGWPPGAEEGRPSCLVNLSYLLTLQKAADLEKWDGNLDQAAMLSRQIAKVRREIRDNFLHKSTGLLRDLTDGSSASEHAQIFGVLAGVFEKGELNKIRSWLFDPPPGTARATIYFQFYLFEAFRMLNLGGEIPTRLHFWHNLIEQGLLCPVESPEPARTDCHAWSSHPVYHLPTSVAGIQPGGPGFRTVIIRPQPGSLAWIRTRVVHPSGWIDLYLDFAGGECQGTCSLPEGTTGRLEWGELSHVLQSGPNEFICRAQNPKSCLDTERSQ